MGGQGYANILHIHIDRVSGRPIGLCGDGERRKGERRKEGKKERKGKERKGKKREGKEINGHH